MLEVKPTGQRRRKNYVVNVSKTKGDTLVVSTKRGRRYQLITEKN